jgi:hypothetical protein
MEITAKTQQKIDRALQIAKALNAAKNKGEGIKCACNLIGTSERTGRKYLRLLKEGGEEAVKKEVLAAEKAMHEGYKKANHKRKPRKKRKKHDPWAADFKYQDVFNSMMGIKVG